MEKQPSTPSSPMSEHQSDQKSVVSIKSKGSMTPSSGQGNVKLSTTANENMSKLSLFPVAKHSIVALEAETSKSREVLGLASVADLDRSAIENLGVPRKRRFVISLRSRKKPPEIVEDDITVETTGRISGTDLHSEEEKQREDGAPRRRRSAWGAQSIAATATIMTRRSKWVTSQSKRKVFLSIFERYQQIIEDKFGSCVACFFDFVRNLLVMNAWLMLIWSLFVVLPQAIYFDYSSVVGTFRFLDLLKFRGVIGETWLFFGNFEAELPGYHLWFAYFVCILCTFYFSIFWLITGIVMALMDEGGHIILENYNFSYLTFTAWDYSLRNTEATDILCLGIANSFRDLISDVELNRLVQAMKAIDKTKLYLRRALAWFITLFLTAAGCAIIFNVVTRDTYELFQEWGFSGASREDLLVIYFPSAVFSIVNIAIPAIIYQLPRFEFYIKPQLEVYITIGRVFLLHVADMVSLFLALKLKIRWDKYTGCGGTLIGQEIFKLIIIDTFVMFGTAFIVYVVYYLVFKFQKREFFMPAIVLKVIQEQTIIWIGTLACPLMPAFGCLFLVLTFFTYYYVICHFCKPTSKRWLQPQRNIFFLAMTVVALMVLTITFLAINLMEGIFLLSKLVDETNPSQMKYANQTLCGPLNITSGFSPVQDFITQIRNDNANAGKFLDIFCSPVLVVTALFVLVSMIYLLVCRVRWEVEKKLVLLAEVQMERLQEKKFHFVAGDKARHVEK